jgi:hypothetical protein
MAATKVLLSLRALRQLALGWLAAVAAVIGRTLIAPPIGVVAGVVAV